MTMPVDHATRQRALDTRRSYAVAAPAGSGKTALLTQRMLRLLAEAETPEQILCMTFTRKAATEMRQRLVAALQMPQLDPQPADEFAQEMCMLAQRVLSRDNDQNWRLIESPTRLRIMTIDSFCWQLANQLPFESVIGSPLEPLENTDLHYRRAIHDLLEELESPGPLGNALTTLLAHLDNDLSRFESLLTVLLGKREQWLPYIIGGDRARPALENALRALVTETLEQAAVLLGPAGSDLALLLDYAAGNLEHSNHPLRCCLGLSALPAAIPDHLPQWRGIVELLLTKSHTWRKTINKTSGFPSKADADDPAVADARKNAWQELTRWCQHQDGLLELLADIRFLPDATYNEAQWQILEALACILPQLSARLSWVFQSDGVCDFTEVSLGAMRALGDSETPTDLTLRLDTQIHHILVDEFQDTASIQFRILERLTAGWQFGDGRTLFFVGDAMQSLYGFRNANVGLFLDVRQHPLGEIELEPLDLTVNFRSQAGVVDWVNRIFSNAFPAHVDISRGAVPYAPAVAVHPLQQGNAVSIDVFEDDPARLQEAEQVAARVIAAQSNTPQGVIAILVRGRAHLLEILPALREQDIHWRATDIEPLAACMPVIDLMSLTRAMLNPADRIAWLALLRAPWCGLALDDLLHVVTTPLAENPLPAGQRWPLIIEQLRHFRSCPALSVTGQRILARVTEVIFTGWQQRHRKSLRIWLEGIWLKLGGPAALNDGAGLAQCQQYWDLLEAKTGDACYIPDWSVFEDAVHRLFAGRPGTVEHTADLPPVHIMTIHKAKGLEFDTVIIPGLDRRTRSDNSQLLLWRERVSASGETQLLLSPPPKIGAGNDALFDYLKREEALKNRLETTRVLYVACTRAKQRLHLLFQEPAKQPSASSLLASLWPALADELSQPGANCEVVRHPGSETAAALAANTSDAHRYQWRLPADWQFPEHAVTASGGNFLHPANCSDDDTNTMDRDADTTIDLKSSDTPSQPEQDSGQSDNDDARKAGILLHRTLRSLTLEGLSHWNKQRIDRQVQVWRQQIRGMVFTDPDAAVKILTQALRNCLTDADNAWLFDNGMEASACELALGYLDENDRPRTAIIDRTFVTAGERWIVDFKLTAPTPGQNDQQFLIAQKHTYTAQLNHYAKLMSVLCDLPIKTALYFPLMPRLQLISDQ